MAFSYCCCCCQCRWHSHTVVAVANVDGIFMDANENGYGPCLQDVGDLHRYPCPYQPELKSKIAAFRSVCGLDVVT